MPATGLTPLVDGIEGRRSLALVLAIYEAAGVGPVDRAREPHPRGKVLQDINPTSFLPQPSQPSAPRAPFPA